MNMYIALFVGTLELSPSTNQTISVCSTEKWYFPITSYSKLDGSRGKRKCLPCFC